MSNETPAKEQLATEPHQLLTTLTEEAQDAALR
jgi:hypothetical protein